jgi:hypothetical protein
MAFFDNAEEDEKLITAPKALEASEEKTDYADILAQYESLRKSGDEEAASAQKMANFKNTVLNVGDGLSGALGGYAEAVSGGKVKADNNSAFFQEGIAQNNKKVAGIRAGTDQRIGDLVKKDSIGREIIERGQKDLTFNALNDATSQRSQLTQNLAITKLREQARVADEAGDKEGAAHLRSIEATIKEKSAADIGNMGLLDGSGYTALLNNKKADARAAENARGENRRDKSMTNKMEADMRGIILKDPIMKEAAKGYMGLKSANKMIAMDNGIADESLLVSWQKGMDPLSVVRESEFSRTVDGAGLMQKIDIMIGQAKNGKRLTPELRKQISDAMSEMQSKYQDYTSSVMDIVESNIASNGLNRDNIYGQFHKDLSGMGKPQTPAPSNPAPTPTTAPAPTTPPANNDAKIDAFMQKNKITDRNEAIEILKANGKI